MIVCQVHSQQHFYEPLGYINTTVRDTNGLLIRSCQRFLSCPLSRIIIIPGRFDSPSAVTSLKYI